MCQHVLSVPQAVETVVNDGDIGQGQRQDSDTHMDRSTTKTTKHTTTETIEVTNLHIPIAVIGSLS